MAKRMLAVGGFLVRFEEVGVEVSSRLKLVEDLGADGQGELGDNLSVVRTAWALYTCSRRLDPLYDLTLASRDGDRNRVESDHGVA